MANQEAAAATEEGKGNKGEEEEERQEAVVSLARTLKPSISNSKATCLDLLVKRKKTDAVSPEPRYFRSALV